MRIKIILPDLINGDWTHSDVEYYTSGDLKGYIQGTIEVYDKVSNSAYASEFLFRVYDPENGNSLTMVSFSETPKEKIKDRVAETWELLNEQLIRFSLAANLKGVLTADISHNYPAHDYEIRQGETGDLYFYVDYISGYDLSQWTIPDAMADHDALLQ